MSRDHRLLQPAQSAGVVLMAVAACSAATATAARSPLVPSPVAHDISRLADGDAFLPTFLPAGYRYAAWKKDAFRAVPLPDEDWFEVTFKRGGARLTWKVKVANADPGANPCGALSIGHATAGRQTVYWAAVDKGSRSQDSWMCVASSDAKLLRFDVIDYGPRLTLATARRVVSSARSLS
jgi:hypothetical protein